jgi:predicted transcriptional regulator
MRKILKPKGRIGALRERPVRDFIDGECGSRDVLTVRSDASPEQILEKILDPTNREDTVVVIQHRSEAPAVGLITHADFLNWVKRGLVSRAPSAEAPRTAWGISRKDFFYVMEDEPLQKAIDLMKEHKVSHVVVLNNEEEKHFVGWVTRRSVLRRLGAT